QLFRELAQSVDLLLEIVDDAFALTSQLEVRRHIAGATREFLVLGQRALEAPPLAVELLRALLVRPDAGVGKLMFDFSQLSAEGGRVKDSCAGPELYRGRRRIRVRVLPP